MSFKIVVRSYRRSETILSHTLGLLREQGDLDLSSCLYVVVDEGEAGAYEEALSGYPMAGLLACRMEGGHSPTNHAADLFPEGERLVFMDDDHPPSWEWLAQPPAGGRRPLTNLGRYILDGFATLDAGYGGIFGFRTGSNGFWKGAAPWKEWSPKPVYGGIWGAYNDRGMIKTDQGHVDDLIRSARYLDRYRGTVTYNWIGQGELFNNSGGMQSSSDRGTGDARLEVTRMYCERALRDPVVARYYKSELLLDRRQGYYNLAPKAVPSILKGWGKGDTRRKWSTYFQAEPDPIPEAADPLSWL